MAKFSVDFKQFVQMKLSEAKTEMEGEVRDGLSGKLLQEEALQPKKDTKAKSKADKLKDKKKRRKSEESEDDDEDEESDSRGPSRSKRKSSSSRFGLKKDKQSENNVV